MRPIPIPEPCDIPVEIAAFGEETGELLYYRPELFFGHGGLHCIDPGCGHDLRSVISGDAVVECHVPGVSGVQ